MSGPDEPDTVGRVLDRATAVLTAAAVPAPDDDAAALVAHVLSLDRDALRAGAATAEPVNAGEGVRIDELVRRRAAREPLAHLVGHLRFRGLVLAVGPGAFVPRRETEQVVQLAIDALVAAPGRRPIGVDLGSGCGAIALAMAAEVPQAVVFGVEVSPAAYAWLERNVGELGMSNAHPVLADLADALPDLDGSADVVMSNPPYIPLGMDPRDIEVRLHDPGIALYGGADGMGVLRRVSTTARRLLRAGGTLVIEHGERQATQVAEALTADGWDAIACHPDASGRDRATTALR